MHKDFHNDVKYIYSKELLRDFPDCGCKYHALTKDVKVFTESVKAFLCCKSDFNNFIHVFEDMQNNLSGFLPDIKQMQNLHFVM